MKEFFKIGEISKLYHISADSLRYYEELGLLTPKRGENQYRQYSLHDLWRLNVIRDLRSLDFSMEQIKDYMDNRSIRTTGQLLSEELHIIEQKIQNLTELRENVIERLSIIKEAETHPIGIIEKKYFAARRCHMIHSGYETDEQMDMLIKRLLNKDAPNLYIIGNNRIGSIIPLKSLERKLYRDYESVFIIDKAGKEELPAGEYLTVCYRGDCNQNALFLPNLLEYAKEQNLTPAGPVLEILWIDIHQAEDTREHITELQLRCE